MGFTRIIWAEAEFDLSRIRQFLQGFLARIVQATARYLKLARNIAVGEPLLVVLAGQFLQRPLQQARYIRLNMW